MRLVIIHQLREQKQSLQRGANCGGIRSQSSLVNQLRQIVRYREAIRTMVARDLKVRYSNSVLGVLWSLFNPLLITVVYTLVFTFLFPNAMEKFPVFFLAGLLPWSFFNWATLSCTTSIIANGHLISRVYFPRDILPLSMVLSNLVNFLLALIPLLGVALAFRLPLRLPLLMLPVLILIQCLLSLGIGLFLAALNVHFRDTQQVVEVLLQAMFFLTPIIYPLEFIQDSQAQLMMRVLNPLTSLVTSYQDIIYAGRWPEPTFLAITTIEALVLLAFGYWFFHKNSPYFVEQL